ncbi:MAG: hypothetical protein HGB05_10605, partial [Chloroflexi bacterium]|nr:hypothetical protein [Chloroflexota bacterium]
MLPITFALVGALILSRQPRNVIGWLLIVPALAFALSPLTASMIGNTTTVPAAPSFWWYLALYLNGAGWVFFIFPLFLIALLFPTGKPVSPRWWWAVGYWISLLVFFLVVAALIDRIGPLGDTGEMPWSVPNPIGFITREQQDVIFGMPWSTALGALTLLSAASVIVRYRRAGLIEREQMKWLLFAVGLFAAAYIPSVLTSGEMQGLGGAVLNFLFLASTLAIPIAIGIAILRYRLFDIDVLIRTTLVDSVGTALLALIYFGGVVLVMLSLGILVALGTGAGGAGLGLLLGHRFAVLFTRLYQGGRHDTVVVPMGEDEFRDILLGQDARCNLQLHYSMVSGIRYIAFYRTAESAITHVARVKSVKSRKGQGKDRYVLHFRAPVTAIGPLRLVPGGKERAPQI